ncbi:LacI family transcriptional regulator [Acuticoccus sp. M5D2P5]|uniref:LacI family DNA-binding transcriptional regulator n=1 Tax=Acuticoccus kalidii TaxID=2910977 RepID=UPI001F1DBF15|nr:LacI family DNA-binding transcriptional regulator [Acuticoccus kalidii]MCF3933082.1 LacI family transcriptional regulator [Acuticoccus kalidii]
MRRKRVGIKDIARIAKLSPAAVSYALNGTGRLDSETRKRVIAIANELGYRANINARHLRGKTSGLLAVAASVRRGQSATHSGMDYIMSIWQSAAAAALERGYMLLLLPLGIGADELSSVPLDGGIVIDPIVRDPLIDDFNALELPVVTIGQDVSRAAADTWWVDNDHAALTRLVLEHLTDKGAERIGAILTSSTYAYSDTAREVYERWGAERGMSLNYVTIDETPTESAGYNAALKMLTTRPGAPDAIYALIDRFAVGTMFAAAAVGYVVPRDLMIVSGNDGVATRSSTVPITAANLGTEALGRNAVSMLIDRVEGTPTRQHVVVPSHLEIRRSTEPSGRS